MLSKESKSNPPRADAYRVYNDYINVLYYSDIDPKETVPIQAKAIIIIK